MVYYNIHSLICLIVNGRGSLNKNLEVQFASFAVDKSQPTKETEKIEIEVTPIPRGNILLGKLSKDCYQRDHERFIIMRNGAALELDGTKKLIEQRRLRIEGNANIGLVMLVTEALIRLKVIDRKVVLLHAAAVAKRGQAVLLPAWQSSGKTSACLALVKHGFDYLADDRVWVGLGGKVLSYPRYIRLNRSNIHLFSNLLSSRQRLQYLLHCGFENLFLKVKTAGRSQVLKKLVQSGYLLPDIAEPLKTLAPTARVVDSAQLKAFLFLQKSGDPYGRTSKLSAEVMSDYLGRINFYEWNHELMLHATAHDLLFPDSEAWVPEVYAFQNQERIVIRDLTENPIRQGLNVPFEQALFPPSVLSEIDGFIDRF